MATARPAYYCHKCQKHIGNVSDLLCPHCHEDFIEEVAPQNASQSWPNQQRPADSMQYHHSTPYGNTTIFIGGGGGGGAPSHHHHIHQHPGMDPNYANNNLDLGTFLQTVMGQLAGGLVGVGGPQFPSVMHHMGPGGHMNPMDIDAFLTQFLNQMGENSGPAPAAEDRINAIPTVQVTAEQERDNLQCAICMDDFKAKDQAKRLPCTHHFHEACILRWLRLHGTCPTCRVTLDGNNTSRGTYTNFPPPPPPSSSNNRRNNNNPSGLQPMDFD